MREHHALGATGGAAGVHQRGEVGVLPRHDLHRVRADQLPQRDGARLLALADDPLQGRNPGRGAADLGQEIGRGDHRARLAVDQDVVELGVGEQEDRRRDHRPRPPQRGVEGADIGGVGHHHHHAVARPDAQGRQPAREAAPALEEVARAEHFSLEGEHLSVAVARERLLRQARQVVLADGSHLGACVGNP